MALWQVLAGGERSWPEARRAGARRSCCRTVTMRRAASAAVAPVR